MNEQLYKIAPPISERSPDKAYMLFEGTLEPLPAIEEDRMYKYAKEFAADLLEWIECTEWEALRENEWFIPMTECEVPLSRKELIEKYIKSIENDTKNRRGFPI